VGERVGLLTAELEQERTAATEEAGALGHDAPEDLGAVAAAVVGEPRLEREGVTRQQRQRGRRHVWHDANDDVDASFEHARQRGEQVAAVGLHAVGCRAGHGTLVDVGSHDARSGPGRGQGLGDRSGPGAEIDRSAGRWQALDGATSERLTLPPRYVDTGINADLHVAERDAPGDPGEWLARESTPDERVEEVGIAGRAREQLVCL